MFTGYDVDFLFGRKWFGFLKVKTGWSSGRIKLGKKILFFLLVFSVILKKIGKQTVR